VVASAPYRAQAWLAAPAGSVGGTTRLVARERGTDGAVVKTWDSNTVTLAEAFQEVHLTAYPLGSGDVLELVVVGTASVPGQRTYVDAVSLTAGMPVPAGYAADQRVFVDTFGGPSYRLTDRWNFGLTDKNADGRPWSFAGTEPYWGSGTHGYFPACVHDQPQAEYSLPEQISQSSTGSPYNAFSATGSGLLITAEPRPLVANGCPYTWVSGALNTYGREEFGGNGKTMYVQVRAKMPSTVVDGRRTTNGSWGSIWTLPGRSNPEHNQVEVDLMEAGYLLGDVDPLQVIASNLHTDTQVLYDSGTDLSKGYHTYAAQVDSRTGSVAFYLDGQEYAAYPSGGPAGPMFLLLNLHMAENSQTSTWHAPVEAETPMEMRVSEVQVYEKP
jgi:hypothetical protein